MTVHLQRVLDPLDCWGLIEPGLDELVQWTPDDLTKGAIAARLLHGDALLYLVLDLDGGEDGYHGFLLVEALPEGDGLHVMGMQLDQRGALGRALDLLAEMAERLGMDRLECHSRRPGMGRHLGPLGWAEVPGGRPLPSGFRRFVRCLAEPRRATA